MFALFNEIRFPTVTEFDTHVILSSAASIRHFIEANNAKIAPLIEELIEKFHQMLNRAKFSVDKITVIRALGNIRYNIDIPFVVQFLNFQEDMEVQKATLSACQKLLFSGTSRYFLRGKTFHIC